MGTWLMTQINVRRQPSIARMVKYIFWCRMGSKDQFAEAAILTVLKTNVIRRICLVWQNFLNVLHAKNLISWLQIAWSARKYTKLGAKKNAKWTNIFWSRIISCFVFPVLCLAINAPIVIQILMTCHYVLGVLMGTNWTRIETCALYYVQLNNIMILQFRPASLALEVAQHAI